MAIVDPHHHLWDLGRIRYPWLEAAEKTAFYGSYAPLARNYGIEDYLGDAKGQGLVKSVHIQAEADPADPVAETRWLSELASRHGFPCAMVAYADLTNSNVESVLEEQRSFSRVRGVRQILNFHPDPNLSYQDRNLLEDPLWRQNFGLLSVYGLSFDLQLYYQQMAQAAEIICKHPSTQVILNHTGMPVERDPAGVAGWRSGMEALAACDNVAVKISGLGMTDPGWRTSSIRPFVLETIDMFGVSRCMFASNFPVDKLFGNYSELFDAFRSITRDFSTSEREMLFNSNAAKFYRI